MTARLAAVPGVAAVTYSENGLFSGTESANTVQVPGFTARTASDTVAAYDNVGPGYVSTLGAHLVVGRDIAERDIPGRQRVALINETMARFYFGDRNPLGTPLVFSDGTQADIVGVVADTRDHSLTQAPARRFYLPAVQRTQGEMTALRFEIRVTGEPAALVDPVRRAIVAAAPGLPVASVQALPAMMAGSLRTQRLLARLAAGFGVVALLLCALGLYGILSYAIARRTGELGIRMALGASRGGVVRLVLRDAALVVGWGALVGIPLAFWGQAVLRGTLEGAAPADGLALGSAVVVLAAAAFAAAMIPALRAARVDPATALRQE
jgi:predicted permease